MIIAKQQPAENLAAGAMLWTETILIKKFNYTLPSATQSANVRGFVNL